MTMLVDSLRELAATGTTGFEGLIQRLLNRLTGYQFYLAQAGTQLGRDMSSERVNATILAIECKRYGEETELKKPELLGKIVEATVAIPRLDVWVLVASRAVPDQVYTALKDLGERFHIDVEVISDGDGLPSTLEILCAQGADILLDHFRASHSSRIAALATELENISQHPDFTKRRDRLKAAFTQTAGIESTRYRLREWLLTQFGSDVNSRAHLGQVIDVDARQRVGRLVPRNRIVTEFDHWLSTWPLNRTPLVVLGEEGDGKTWAVAQWICTRLYQQPGFPIVLWVPSRAATTQDVTTLIADGFINLLGGSRSEWLARLQRWSGGSESTGPTVILICDGMNERHDPSWWRPVLESLSADPWRLTVAPIFTSRTTFWSALKHLPHIRCHEWTVPPFDDDELMAALDQVGIARASLPEAVLRLARKPRYFELAVRHHQAMADSGDVTEARLIYEDWRDRYSRRANLPDAAAFRDVIAELARQHRAGHEVFNQRDIIEAVPSQEERATVARELETGGILVRDGDRWRVEPSRLILGFGLLLADELRLTSSDRDPSDVLAAHLEPEPDMDLKAQILEQAALHALETPTFTTQLRTLLLVAWLTHRNQSNPDAHAVDGYFPLDPMAYLRAAEAIWGTESDDPWAERLLAGSYARWSQVQKFIPIFAAAFERWLGFVHIDGSPVAINPEDRIKRKNSLAAVIGTQLEIGPFEYAGLKFTAIADDDLLRLGRLALAIISSNDRRPYVKAILTAYLTDALMQFPDRLKLCEWILRSSRDDLWTSFEPEVRRLHAIGSHTVLKAVYRVLGDIGTRPAIDLLDTLPKEDLFPKLKWQQDYENDPCSSGFSWPADACEHCASREDLPTYFLAQQLSRCAPNPSVRIPTGTGARVAAELEHVIPSKVWLGASQTEQEIRLETVEPVIARCAPAALADKIRSVARDITSRRDLALRQLAYQLLSYRLVLATTEVEIIRSTWEALNKEPQEALSKEQERAEWGLFELLLEPLEPAEQLDLLLQRRAEAQVLTRYRPYFKPLAWAEIGARLRGASDSSERSRVLFFATANPSTLDESASDLLLGCLSDRDRNVRFPALELIYRGSLKKAALEFVKSAWHYRGDDDSVFEDHWGGMIVARWGTDLPYAELRTRISLTQLGMAVQERGVPVSDVSSYADDIHKVWQRIGEINIESTDAALVEVRATVPRANGEFERPSLPSSAFARSIKFIARQATWGGIVERPNPASFLRSPSDEEIQELHDALGAELSRQRAAGNSWFAERFDTACLKEIVALRPELVSRWLGESEQVTRRMWLARSFYEALCEVLLDCDPERGAKLYTRLQRPGAVRFVERHTAILLLDRALFGASQSPQAHAMWNRRLDDAKSDKDLLEIAMLAETEPARRWLSERVTADLASGVPFLKVRALRLLGFMGTNPASVQVVEHVSDNIEWQVEQRKVTVQDWNRNQWARSWFECFATDPSEDAAIASFRLFLLCVDNRFWMWCQTVLEGAPADRRRFVVTSGSEIERAIESNERDLKKRFLGMDVADDQAWPWIGLS